MARVVATPSPELPAILGGRPTFPGGLPFARPSVPDPPSVAREIERVLASGILTDGPRVRELERRAAEYVGVRHCIAVSSCTSGLLLLLRAADLSGEVIVPSFTFPATVHAVMWNALRPAFADIDPETLTLEPGSAALAVGARTSAILATHIFGTPCDAQGLAAVARRNGLRLFFDAAHAFGSRKGEVPVGGLGDGEVFSLSPTKVLVAAEGGLIATDDDVLAERCRIGRNYGNPGDYDCRLVGLNARMSEVHAAIALASLDGLEERIAHRNALAAAYCRTLADVRGVSFPAVRQGDRSTFKDFTILVEPAAFGVDADTLAVALRAEGIETRRYYTPPVHVQRAYRSLVVTNGDLPVTEAAASRVLTLPMWSDMTEEHLALVGEAIVRIHRWVWDPSSRGSAEKLRRMGRVGTRKASYRSVRGERLQRRDEDA